VTGLLVPPDDPASLADALNALLHDPVRAAAMGRAGRERAVADFSWDAVAAQTVALYAELTTPLQGEAVCPNRGIAVTAGRLSLLAGDRLG
jgi:glycosyltransferase involved in cell wall biosynthesis